MSSRAAARPSGMGELVITTFMTLDGVMQAPGGRDEDREGGFEHGGWQAPVFDPASGDRMLEEFQTWDAYLLGRRTYDIFASLLAGAAEDGPFTRLMNALPRYVASHTLTQADWPGTTILSGDVAAGGRRDQGAPRADRPLGQRRPRPDAAAPRARRPPRSLDLPAPPRARASASSPRAPCRPRSAGRRRRRSRAARSTPSTSAPARRRTARWATGASSHELARAR